MRNYSIDTKVAVIEILSEATGLQISTVGTLDDEIDAQIQEFADTFDGDMNAIIPLIVEGYARGYGQSFDDATNYGEEGYDN
jgi:hypothetical protein